MSRPLSHPFAQILSFIGLLVVVHAVNVLLDMALTVFGVIPRSLVGLRGVLFSPLLHGDWAHLFANLPPLAVMLGLLAFTRGRKLWPTTFALWAASGLAVWLVGRPLSIQVGASGLIYALASYLVVAAWTRRDLKSGLAALIVLFFYGGIVWGVIPGRPGVSWEGHLAGAIAGGIIGATSSRKSSRTGE